MDEKMKKEPTPKSILSNDNGPKVKAEPKPKAPAAEKKPEHEAAAGGKRKHKHTHIEHHENGTHTVRHTPVGGGEEASYAAQDLDAVHDGLEHHVGEPNGDEGQQQQPQGQPGGDPQMQQQQPQAPQGGAGAPPPMGA